MADTTDKLSSRKIGLEVHSSRYVNAAEIAHTLELVRDKSGWASRASLPRGTGMGVATYYSHLGYFAEVMQVKVEASGNVVVQKVFVAADVGIGFMARAYVQQDVRAGMAVSYPDRK